MLLYHISVLRFVQRQFWMLKLDVCFQKPKATASLNVGVAMAVIGSSFQYGYNIAVVNAPADVSIG